MSKGTTIKVGDTVQFQYGLSKVIGTVVEDRGPIGIKGRRLYGINFTNGPYFSAYIELPAVDFEVVPSDAEKSRPLA